MAHEAENPSVAIIPASAASNRRKRLILLCCEDLRPIACSLEDALRDRGWEVDLELGADAKPWVQKVPLVRPSLRVLCVPGTVDRGLAQQLRAAFEPDPDADLHILGVDDSPSLVQEIERLAGVRTPARRSLHAAPRLAHATLVERQVRTERRWLVGATSALAAFAITLGGVALVEHSARAPELSMRPAASITAPVTAPVATRSAETPSPAAREPFSEPVLAAVAPTMPLRWDELPPPEDDDEIVLLDDEPALEPEPSRSIDVLASPLAEASSSPASTEVIPAPRPPVTEALELPSPGSALPPGVLPVVGMTTLDAEVTAPARRLPPGFLPVAGMTVAPRLTSVDPFLDAASPAPEAFASAPIATVDPFAAPVDSAVP